MNETIRTLLSRRSIRAYKTEQIKDEDLNTILKAGSFAPSAMNQQSWHFTVVQNKEVFDKINKACKKAFENSNNPNFRASAKDSDFSICYNAPTYIIVSGKDGNIAPQVDCGLALENMFLAAASLGIGSCWIHAVNFLFATEEGKALKKELGIPEGYTPCCSGAFGYSAQEAREAAPRRKNFVTMFK